MKAEARAGSPCYLNMVMGLGEGSADPWPPPPLFIHPKAAMASPRRRRRMAVLSWMTSSRREVLG